MKMIVCDRCKELYASPGSLDWNLIDAFGTRVDLCHACQQSLFEWFHVNHPGMVPRSTGKGDGPPSSGLR